MPFTTFFRACGPAQLNLDLNTDMIWTDLDMTHKDSSSMWLHVCRPCTVTASTAVVCYTLQRKAFDDVLGPIQDVWRFEALRKVPILFSLSDSQLFSLAKCMTYHAIPAGQLVFCKGEPGLPAAQSPCIISDRKEKKRKVYAAGHGRP